MNTFTCSTCGKEWPENYCPDCSHTINRGHVQPAPPSLATQLPPAPPTPNPADNEQSAISSLRRFVAKPAATQAANVVKPTTIDCTGNFRVLQPRTSNSAGFRTTASTHGGMTKGFIQIDTDAVVLHKRLSFAVGALMFLVFWIGSLVLLFILQSLLTTPGNQPAPNGFFMPISLVIAVCVPWLVAWRVRRFERWFAITDIVRVQADIGEIQFEIQSCQAAEGHAIGLALGGQPVPVIEKVLFSPFNANDAANIGRVLKSVGVPVNERGEAEKSEFLQRLALATPIAWVTPVLFGMNLLVFLLMCVSDHQAVFKPSVATLLKWGADYGPLTGTGQQWWRLLTSCFVHIGLWHLLFNMLALWQAGRIVEKLLGNWFYLALYLGCGLLGSLTSLYFQPHLVSAGASGAIFGIYGALLGFIARQREALPRGMSSGLLKFGLTFLAYNLYASLGSLISIATDQAHGPHIDLACHAGGLVSGLLFGFAAARPLDLAPRRTTTMQRSISLAGSMLVLAVLLSFPFFKNGVSNLINYQELGGMYYRGDGVARDPAASVHWFQAAGEQGDLASQKALGSIFYRGDGVERNIGEAVRWFTKAGEQNDVDAEKFLAGIFFSGQGVATNNLEGVKWLTKVADQGADQAFDELEKALAFAYYNGDGVPQSTTEAVKWMTRVANRGDKDAKAKLKILTAR